VQQRLLLLTALYGSALLLLVAGCATAGALGTAFAVIVRLAETGTLLATGHLRAGVARLQLLLPPATVDAGSFATPELSLAWYVHSVVFTRYLPYHSLIMLAHPMLFALPATWRLRGEPSAAVAVVAGVAALFDATAGWALSRLLLVAALCLAHPAAVARE